MSDVSVEMSTHVATMTVWLADKPFGDMFHRSRGCDTAKCRPDALGPYVHNWRFNGPVFAVFDHLGSPKLLAAVLTGLVTATWLRR
jgi:hypothetical protein